MRNDGGYAFPRPLPQLEAASAEALAILQRHAGMSLRDHFAGQAFAECLRVAADQTPGQDPLLSDLFAKAATYAYFAADAMIAERDKL